MRLGATLGCDGCDNDIDPSGPGVTKSMNTDAWWQPFLEDMRSDPSQHWHPRCYAEAFGIDALRTRSIVRTCDAGSAELPLGSVDSILCIGQSALMVTPDEADDGSTRERAIADHALEVARRAIDEVTDHLRAADVTLIEAVDASHLLRIRRDVEVPSEVTALRQTAQQLLFAAGFAVHDDDSDGADD